MSTDQNLQCSMLFVKGHNSSDGRCNRKWKTTCVGKTHIRVTGSRSQDDLTMMSCQSVWPKENPYQIIMNTVCCVDKDEISGQLYRQTEGKTWNSGPPLMWFGS